MSTENKILDTVVVLQDRNMFAKALLLFQSNAAALEWLTSLESYVETLSR